MGAASEADTAAAVPMNVRLSKVMFYSSLFTHLRGLRGYVRSG
jgi:hypothetical protein